jgi:hypothetical protein
MRECTGGLASQVLAEFRTMQSDNEFIGTVVQVWAKDPAKGGMLENAAVRQIGGRYFIVGTLAARGDGSDDERVGCTFWFAWDDVYMLTEFPSVEAAREAYSKRAERKHQDSRPKRRGWFK